MHHPEALQPLSCVLDSSFSSFPSPAAIGPHPYLAWSLTSEPCSALGAHLSLRPPAPQLFGCPGDFSSPLSCSPASPWLHQGRVWGFTPKPCSLSATCSPWGPSAPWK